MSEYWKSTPKYWCKHCKTFVRDTKLEKTNHEATAKHQGNIKRFLRDLHRGHEREERERDRAKSEIERLNGVVSEPSSTAKTWATQSRHGAASSASTGREPTPLERKAQLAKLAEMGVAVPEDYRREVAMAGDWQTVAERPIWNGIKKEEGLEDFKDFKPDLTLNVGVRKRKLVDRDEEAEGGPTVVRKGWGSTTRRYPGSDNDNDDDLDTLLGMKPVSEQGRPIKSEESSKQPNADKPDGSQSLRETDVATQTPSVKQEDSRDGINLNSVPDQTGLPDATVKQEDEGTQPAVFFKKRKSKSSATC